jgi:hypothetical protein
MLSSGVLGLFGHRYHRSASSADFVVGCIGKNVDKLEYDVVTTCKYRELAANRSRQIVIKMVIKIGIHTGIQSDWLIKKLLFLWCGLLAGRLRHAQHLGDYLNHHVWFVK